MNIFEKYKKIIINIIEKNRDVLLIQNKFSYDGVIVESPPDEFDFDLSCNICMVLGKKNKINPKDLAIKLKNILINSSKDFEMIEVAGPGFLNLKLNTTTTQNTITDILKCGKTYGSFLSKKKYNIEFVSANPTGPMHVGHCRGAIYGDVLSNLLKFNGNIVDKEYYINDYGNQIINFTKSVYLRIREIKYGEKFIQEENIYPGAYIIDIANKILQAHSNLKFDNFNNSYEVLSKDSLIHSMDLIKSDLKKLGITHDNFVSESKLIKENLVVKAINSLKDINLVEEGYLEPPKGEDNKDWKKIKRLIFKSELFGDDTNRALQKNDGSWTYFANDVAYHAYKVSRKYDVLINVLGADHTGYVKRIQAAVNALSNSKIILNCKVCQLVKLFKNGKPFKMSKRAGDFISANDLLNEVNKDSIRFMMLNRSNDVELDFDFDKVLEKSKENPVFYVQYCYARISSLGRIIKTDIDKHLELDKSNFNLNEYECKLLRKIYDWPKIIETASKKLEPHRIPFYLYDLSVIFHSYWSKGNENEKYKFIVDGEIKNKNTLLVIKLVKNVIENGMNILGVSLPKKM